MDMIDSYEKGRLLVNDGEYMSFWDNLMKSQCVSVSERSKIYSHLFYYAIRPKTNIGKVAILFSQYRFSAY